MTRGKVLVIGSVNVDDTVFLRHLPRPGETVIAERVDRGFGGKGGNQAVAAAGTGCQTLLAACVGSDQDGRAAVEQLRGRGVDVSCVRTVEGLTGRATVLLEQSGENAIVVDTGANAMMTAELAASAVTASSPVVVLTGGEVSLEVVEAALTAALTANVRTVLNLAPFQELPVELPRVDVLVLNEIEAAQATGLPDGDDAARALLHRATAVLVTMGARGAALATAEGVALLAAETATVVDTTGAGDVVSGVLAAYLAMGRSVRESAEAAVRAGSAAVTHVGAQPHPSASRVPSGVAS